MRKNEFNICRTGEEHVSATFNLQGNAVGGGFLGRKTDEIVRKIVDILRDIIPTELVLYSQTEPLTNDKKLERTELEEIRDKVKEVLAEAGHLCNIRVE